MDVPDQKDKIGEHTYKCVALPQDDWEDLGDFLAQTLGAPIATLVRGYDVAYLEELPFAGSGGVGLIFAAFSKKASRETMSTMREHMAKSLHIANKGDWEQLTMDKQQLHWAKFRGELPGCVELFLRSQYEDFFEGLLGLKLLSLAKDLSLKRKPKSQGEPSPTTSEDETPSDTGS
jgi:hypothetical protein